MWNRDGSLGLPFYFPLLCQCNAHTKKRKTLFICFSSSFCSCYYMRKQLKVHQRICCLRLSPRCCTFRRTNDNNNKRRALLVNLKACLFSRFFLIFTSWKCWCLSRETRLQGMAIQVTIRHHNKFMEITTWWLDTHTTKTGNFYKNSLV